MAVASLVLGILGLVFSFFSLGILGFLGIILGILGIIFGALARSKTENRGIATAGFVISIICVALNVVVLVACVGIFAAAGTAVTNM